MNERIAVVIVSKDTCDATLASVRSALSYGRVPACDVRVIVVDNASRDATCDLLEETYGGTITVIGSKRNLGFGAACNLGAREIPDAEWFLFMNGDAKLTAGALGALVRALRERQSAGIAGPRFTFPDGRPQPSVRGHPTPLALLHQHTAARFLGMGRRAYQRYKDPLRGAAPLDITPVPVTLGACMLVRGGAFRDLGGFDERYFLYFEEADLQRRALALRAATVLAPDAIVVHEGGASSDRDRERALRWYLRSLFLYVDRFGGRGWGLAYRVVFKPLFLVKMGTDLIRDVAVLVFRGKAEKRAEVALAGRFLVRGVWGFLVS